MSEFDFKENDIIEFCDEQYLVIENYGSSGMVKEYYDGCIGDIKIGNFYWNYQGEKCKLVGTYNAI